MVVREGARSSRPLIAHVVFRFDYGGLENGIVNLINRMPDDHFRHCVIALTGSTAFRQRIEKPEVEIYSLDKRAGKDPAFYFRLYFLLRRLQPAIVHTRNIGTLDCLFIAWLAGVPIRIHGEHGWDVYDLHGTSKKYRRLRRLVARFTSRFVTVSEELAGWLAAAGIPEKKIVRICNGVDTQKFYPRQGPPPGNLPADVFKPDSVIIGSVTRFSTVKDPLNLVDAFVELRNGGADLAAGARLLMIGDGELRSEAHRRLHQSAMSGEAWLPGSRDDIPEMLGGMDVFVLCSLREGISNTILEAMASGLPVIATATGGNRELIEDGVTGKLIASGRPDKLAEAMREYVTDPEKRRSHGRRARTKACSEFSLALMIDGYVRLYREALQGAT